MGSAEDWAARGQELLTSREWERQRGLAPEGEAGKDVLRRGYEPCLVALLRLSARRGTDADVTEGWWLRTLARTGHLVRAAELAYTISDDTRQGERLLELVKIAVDAGDPAVAQALAESIPQRQLHDGAMVTLVPVWARAGEREKAVALAERVRYPHNWASVWALLAQAVVEGGDIEQARGFAARAEHELGNGVSEGTEQVLADLVEVAVATGDHDRASALADRLEEATRPRGRTNIWAPPRPFAAMLAREALAGDLRRIDTLLRTPAEPAVEPWVCGWALDQTADVEVDEAGAEADARPLSPRTSLDASDMAHVLNAVPSAADPSVAQALSDRARALLDTVDGREHGVVLRALTLMLARGGHVEQAMELMEGIEPDQRGGWQAALARELARRGDTDRAEALAYAITDRRTQDSTLIEVVQEIARRGDPDRAEALALAITDRWARGAALVPVVREWGRRGDTDRAEALTRTIAYRATRTRALAALVEVSEPPSARRLAAQVVLLDGSAPVQSSLERIAPRSTALVVDQMTGGAATPYATPPS